ncbi:dihydrodipicolinate synthase family protein [bacterium]|nr:dihydrodipicolinate synthase family protein [bacterium]MCB2179369.1 dihydrodipicolinate synthase family protein [bacterium]
MTIPSKTSGVYVAAVTPLKPDLTPDLAAILPLMEFYAGRGCHGALLLGTTGEGPSFSQAERIRIFEAAAPIRKTHPEFHLLAGTGMPSLDATIQLNQAAFNLGFQGVVVLPPYYFRSATEEGLFRWFEAVLSQSIPAEGVLLGYHIPQTSGVALSDALLTRLAEAFPAQFGGIKDSSGDLDHAIQTAARLPRQAILVGNDRLMSKGLAGGASGAITAMANIASPLLRKIYDAYHQGQPTEEDQAAITAARGVLERFVPFPAAVKGLLAAMFGLPLWPVRPPLVEFSQAELEQAADELKTILKES